MVAVEGAQGTNGLIDGGAGKLLFGLEVEKKVEDLTTGEVGHVGLGIKLGEADDPLEVVFYGAVAQAFKLYESGEILIPRLA